MTQDITITTSCILKSKRLLFNMSNVFDCYVVSVRRYMLNDFVLRKMRVNIENK